MSSKKKINVIGKDPPKGIIPTTELIVLHRPAHAISQWWQTLQILSFSICAISGIAQCISMGRISSAFGNQCILNAQLNVDRLPAISNKVRLRHVEVANWGNDSDCSFCQYFPMAGACAAMIIGVLFLEFGSTDALLRAKKSLRDNTWKMVVPGIIVSFVFFIGSCVNIGITIGGLAEFCDHILRNPRDLNITSCVEVFRLPWETERLTSNVPDVDVYANYLIAEIGASLHFVGWFFALFILIIRCGTSVDFVTVKKLKYRSSVDSTETFPVVFDDEDDSDDEAEDDEEPLYTPADDLALSFKPKKKTVWFDDSSASI